MIALMDPVCNPHAVVVSTGRYLEGIEKSSATSRRAISILLKEQGVR